MFCVYFKKLCISVLSVLMTCGVLMCVNVVSDLMYVMRPCLCSLSVWMVVKCGICGVLGAEVSFDYCIVMMSGCVYEMFEFLHGAPFAIFFELKYFNFLVCVLFWRYFVCFVCDSVRVVEW